MSNILLFCQFYVAIKSFLLAEKIFKNNGYIDKIHHGLSIDFVYSWPLLTEYNSGSKLLLGKIISISPRYYRGSSLSVADFFQNCFIGTQKPLAAPSNVTFICVLCSKWTHYFSRQACCSIKTSQYLANAITMYLKINHFDLVLIIAFLLFQLKVFFNTITVHLNVVCVVVNFSLITSLRRDSQPVLRVHLRDTSTTLQGGASHYSIWYIYIYSIWLFTQKWEVGDTKNCKFFIRRTVFKKGGVPDERILAELGFSVLLYMKWQNVTCTPVMLLLVVWRFI